MTNILNKKEIIDLLPHREPMLLIEELTNIKNYFLQLQLSMLRKIVFLYKDIFLTIPLCREF